MMKQMTNGASRAEASGVKSSMPSRWMAPTGIVALFCALVSLGSPSKVLADDAKQKAAVAEARDIVQAHEKSPDFWAPPNFDASPARGKTIWWITDQHTDVFHQWTVAAEEAAKSAGVQFHLFDLNVISLEDHVRAFNLAIAAKADAIVLADATPAVSYAAQIAEAKKHGIPVVSVNGHPIGADTDPKVDGLFADASFDFPAAGRLLADWFVADSNGTGKVLVIRFQGVPPSDLVVEGFRAELKRLGAATTYAEATTSLGPNAQTDTANIAATGILRDPSIGYIIPPFDEWALFAQNGLAQVGPAGAKVKTAGFNTIPPQMQNLQRGGTPLKLDLGASNVWLGYAAVDDALRALSRQPAIHDYHVGFKIFTHENVQGLDVSKENDSNWYGIDYGALFRRGWRVQS